MPKYKSSFLIWTFLIMAITVISGLLFLAIIRLYFAPIQISGEYEFSVDDEATYNTVEASLVKLGFVRNPYLYRLLLVIQNQDKKIRAGRYKLTEGMSVMDLTGLMIVGDAINEEIEVVFPEGYTIREIARRLETLNLISSDIFVASAIMGPDFIQFWILDELETGDSLEGYLFPDTYKIIPNSGSKELITRMLSGMQNQIEALGIPRYPAQHDIGMTLHEILTFASIVEKESPKEDMKTISGVFYNRLVSGYRFESDATINYVLGTKKLIPNNSDIHVPSSYNTYLNSGLPPGPISNPGVNAIQATIEPEIHDYYFFLHTPEGKTILSNTFEEHLRSRKIYWE